MRVLCLGGFVDYTGCLVNELCTRAEVAWILPLRFFPEGLRQAVAARVPVYLLGRGKSLYHPANLLALASASRMIHGFKPDVVHMQAGSSVPLVVFLPFLRGVPIVTTFHDVTLHLGEETRWELFVRYCVRRRSDHIIVHGEKLKDQMVGEYRLPREKVHAIHIGEHEVAPFRKYERDDIREDGNLILFFGRIWEYKGLDYLIRAEPLITKEVPDAKIVIAGVGEDFSRYETMMGSRRENFIIHNYRIPYEEGAELFQRCSVVVLPYVDASQSGVVPTAYGFKKPVVVTDVGSIPEIVDHGRTGFVVPPRDSGALAQAIVRLLKDGKLRREMGENAYKKLKEEFSWDRIAEKTIAVYRKAIDDVTRR